MKLLVALLFTIVLFSSYARADIAPLRKCADVSIHMDNRTKAALELIGGIFWGFEHAAIPDLDPCVEDLLTVAEHVETAIKDFEKQTWDSVLDGIHELGDALKSLASALKECGAVPADIEKMIKVFEEFKDPVTFFFSIGKNIIVNGKEIYAEVKSAHEYWCDKNYLYCGQQIGFIISKILGTGVNIEGTMKPSVWVDKIPVESRSYASRM